MTTVGSLCSGYGGLDLAVETVFADTRVAWYAEWEPAPASVFAHHWPDVRNLHDLTTVNWTAVEPVDILTAGYPCQPFSHAGQRKGTDDERHIWPHIRDAIGVLRPGLVVLENVAGHLSLGGTTVIADLAAVGYDARWMVVRASDVGACHRRARWFCVAHDATRHPRGEFDRERVSTTPDSECDTSVEQHGPSMFGRRSGDAEQVGMGDRCPVADSSRTERGGPQLEGMASRVGAAELGERVSASVIADTDGAGPQGRSRHVVASRENETAAHGRVAVADSACVGSDGREPGRGSGPGDIQGEAGGSRSVPADPDRMAWSPPVTVGRRPRSMDEPGTLERTVGLRRMAWGDYEPAIRRHEQALGRPAPYPTDDANRLNPRFVEWMMMLPDGWVTDVLTTRASALKALGNGVVPPQAAYAIRFLTVPAAGR